MYKRVIACISDLHTGSRYALWPKGLKMTQGNEIGLNDGQEQMLEYWNTFWQVADKFNCDTILDHADSCHGLNVKELGANLMASDLELQKDAYCELLRPHIKGRKYYNITGSGYHQSKDTKIQKEIAEKLGGKFLGAMSNLHLVGTKRVINMAHGEGGAMVYRATAMDREGLFQLAAQAQDRIPKADIIVRGHLHTFLHLHLVKQHIIQLPCWCAFEPNKIMMKSYGKMQPDIGAVLILIDEEDRIDVHHYCYPAPHIDDFVRDI